MSTSTSSFLETGLVDVSSAQFARSQSLLSSDAASGPIMLAGQTSSPTSSSASSIGSTGSSVSSQAFANDQGAGGSVTITTFGGDGSSQTQTVQDFVPGATSSQVGGSVFTTGTTDTGGAANATVSVPAPTPIPTDSTPGSTTTPGAIPTGFDPTSYLAANLDLIQVFGFDVNAATGHFIAHGRAEGRSTTFDADDYLASHGDLIQAFGYDLAAATRHYVQFGASEGRAVDRFDEVAYLNRYSDLQVAFGQSYGLATQHYINHGYAEGRIA